MRLGRSNSNLTLKIQAVTAGSNCLPFQILSFIFVSCTCHISAFTLGLEKAVVLQALPLVAIEAFGSQLFLLVARA